MSVKRIEFFADALVLGFQGRGQWLGLVSQAFARNGERIQLIEKLAFRSAAQPASLALVFLLFKGFEKQFRIIDDVLAHGLL